MPQGHFWPSGHMLPMCELNPHARAKCLTTQSENNPENKIKHVICVNCLAIVTTLKI